MRSIHARKEEAGLGSVLARIQGHALTFTRGTRPVFSEEVPEPNRATLLGFYRSMVAEGLTTGRIYCLLGIMYRLSIRLGHKPFLEVTRDDLIDLLEDIKHSRSKRRGSVMIQEAFSEQTVETYKTAMRKFWKWLKPCEDPEELPPEVRWIKLGRNTNRLLPKDIWTPEEVTKVASLAGNARDRAFVLGLFGSGCRIGEFLPLRRKDVLFDAYSCQAFVDGKTGPRRVRLTPAATVALAAWLDVNPNKSQDAFVWTDILLRGVLPTKHLTYDWAYTMLQSLARRAGLDKPIRPHLLRHSLATYYAPRLTEAVMNEHFGWRQGGRTASVYTHLSGKQVDDQILAVFGRKKAGPETDRAVDVVRCWRCGLENTPASLQCGKCGFPLSDEACRTLVERRQKADDVLDFVTRNPEVMEAISRALAKEQGAAREAAASAALPRDRLAVPNGA